MSELKSERISKKKSEAEDLVGRAGVQTRPAGALHCGDHDVMIAQATSRVAALEADRPGKNRDLHESDVLGQSSVAA